MHAARSPRAPALVAAVAFSAGILAARGLPPALLPAAALSAALVFLLGVFLARRLPAGAPSPGVLSAALLVLLLCCGAARWLDAAAGETALPPGWPGTRGVLVGRIVEQPSFGWGGARFVLAADSGTVGGLMVPLRLKAMVSIGRVPPDRGARPAYGQRVRVSGVIARPSEARNPGEFSQRAFYEAGGITLLVRVRPPDSLAVLGSGGGSAVMRSLVLPVRDHLLAVIDSTTPGEEGAFLKGVLLGERSGLSPETRESFAASGVAHVLAVSGSNVAVIAALAYGLLGMLRVPAGLRIIPLSALLLFYMLLTGSQPPVVRATVMAIVMAAGTSAGRSGSAMNALGVAGLAILVYEPRQLFDVGFQLSFAAVFALLLAYAPAGKLIGRLPQRRWPGRTLAGALRLLAATAAATIGTLPITAMTFGRVSLVGLLANLVVVPAAGASLVLGCVTALTGTVSLWAAQAFAAVNAWLLWLSLATAHAAARLPLAYVETAGMRGVDAAAFYAGVLALRHLRDPLLNRPLLFATAIFLNLAVFLPADPSTRTSPGRARVAFLAVARGQATVVEAPDGRVWLAGAGGNYGAFNDAERVVIPYLRRRGVRSVGSFIYDTARPGAARFFLEHFHVADTVGLGGESPPPAESGAGTFAVTFLPDTGIRGGGGRGLLVRYGRGGVLVLLGPEAARTTWTRVLTAADVVRTEAAWMGEEDRAALCGPAGARWTVVSSRARCPCPDTSDSGSRTACLSLQDEGAVIVELDGTRVERVLWR